VIRPGRGVDRYRMRALVVATVERAAGKERTTAFRGLFSIRASSANANGNALYDPLKTSDPGMFAIQDPG
jgi:hypothetical protein